MNVRLSVQMHIDKYIHPSYRYVNNNKLCLQLKYYDIINIYLYSFLETGIRIEEGYNQTCRKRGVKLFCLKNIFLNILLMNYFKIKSSCTSLLLCTLHCTRTHICSRYICLSHYFVDAK